MTIVAIWCRHEGDDIIGIGPNIPWQIKSDTKRFRNLTLGQTLVVGKKTYESFPGRTLPNRKFVVLTFNEKYEVSDAENHCIATDIRQLKDYPEDLYVSGGASIYELFFSTPDMRPDIVVDCLYHGAINSELEGQPISVHKSVEIMRENYMQLPNAYELDNITTTIWLKKGDFVEQSLVKKIMDYLETEGK